MTATQRAAVVSGFELAGYTGQLRTAPPAGGDELLFVLPAASAPTGTTLRALEQVLSGVLRLKVWVLSDADWTGETIALV